LVNILGSDSGVKIKKNIILNGISDIDCIDNFYGGKEIKNTGLNYLVKVLALDRQGLCNISPNFEFNTDDINLNSKVMINPLTMKSIDIFSDKSFDREMVKEEYFEKVFNNLMLSFPLNFRQDIEKFIFEYLKEAKLHKY
jgi:hypothetical protein